MKHYPNANVRAFCMDGQRGNRAFVFATCPGDDVLIQDCIAMAGQMQCEVTWVQRKSTPSGFGLRFFTSGGEISFCGHGMLATAAWLAVCEDPVDAFVFDVGDSQSCVSPNEDGYWSYEQAVAASEDINSEEAIAAALLALKLSPIKYKHRARLGRSVGAPREKIFIEFSDPEALSSAVIDAQLRDIFCEQFNATGIYIYSICSNNQVPKIQSRHFPIYCSTQEDMATAGIAPTVVQYANLAAGKSEVMIEQGGPSCNNSRLHISRGNTDSARLITGQCVVE